MKVLQATERQLAGDGIEVVYTTAAATKAALSAAGSLSKDLGMCVRILAFGVVPYPLPIDEPSVSSDFVAGRILSELESELEDDEVPDRFVLHYMLTRDLDEALLRLLNPHSLIVIGSRRRFLLSRGERIARKLRKAGHEVLLVTR